MLEKYHEPIKLRVNILPDDDDDDDDDFVLLPPPGDGRPCGNTPLLDPFFSLPGNREVVIIFTYFIRELCHTSRSDQILGLGFARSQRFTRCYSRAQIRVRP